jgi:hypothetical protein
MLRYNVTLNQLVIKTEEFTRLIIGENLFLGLFSKVREDVLILISELLSHEHGMIADLAMHYQILKHMLSLTLLLLILLLLCLS